MPKKLVFEEGQRFGKLVVIEPARKQSGKRGYKCRCDCGNEVIVDSYRLNKGLTKSCGCLQREVASKLGRDDLTGKEFGRLKVIEFAEVRSYTKNTHATVVMWRCKCQCGNETIVAANNLRNGTTRSCGCMQKELAKQRFTTHNMTNTRLYRIWHGMVQRCNNPNNKKYRYYGGRGVQVCDEWQEFEPFHQWAISHGYDDSLSIDRIDYTGNYCPENCRWIDMLEQKSNTRNNVWIEYNGEKHTIAQWERKLGFKRGYISKRLRRGWSIERALTEPAIPRNHSEKTKTTVA